MVLLALPSPAAAWTQIARAIAPVPVKTVIDLSSYPVPQPAAIQVGPAAAASRAQRPAAAESETAAVRQQVLPTISVARRALPPAAVPAQVAAAVSAADRPAQLDGPASAAHRPRLAIEQVRMKPQYQPGEIVISTQARRLYLVTAPGEARAYPIAVPGDDGDQYYGQTRITEKRPDPVWVPTESTRARLEAETGRRLPSAVPAGDPDNALGAYALNLTWPLIRIHGTNNPAEIGQARSAGCFRMYNEDVLELAQWVSVGTAVTVVK